MDGILRACVDESRLRIAEGIEAGSALRKVCAWVDASAIVPLASGTIIVRLAVAASVKVVEKMPENTKFPTN
jgi:hypothetical protein